MRRENVFIDKENSQFRATLRVDDHTFILHLGEGQPTVCWFLSLSLIFILFFFQISAKLLTILKVRLSTVNVGNPLLVVRFAFVCPPP